MEEEVSVCVLRRLEEGNASGGAAQQTDRELSRVGERERKRDGEKKKKGEREIGGTLGVLILYVFGNSSYCFLQI